MSRRRCPDCHCGGGPGGGDGCDLTLYIGGGYHNCPGTDGIQGFTPQCFKTSLDDDVEYHLTPADENLVQCLYVVWGLWWANQYDFVVCGKFSAINGGSTLCLTEPTGNTFKVCVTGCDGEILAGATVNAEGCNDPSDDSEPACFASSGTTDENGCVELALPLLRWRRGNWPNSVTITVAPWGGEGDDHPYAGKTVVYPNVGPGDEFGVQLDPSPSYTCCDLEFRKGPINPSGAPYGPRGKVLQFITSGAATVDEIWDVEVGCDGSACALSDVLAVVGGRPTVATCLSSPYSDGPYDYWQPPALGAGRVPMKVRIWYDDATGWHCSATVVYTVARPVLDGCNADPTQQSADFFGWLRSDASCDRNADPMLSVPPDPTLAYPYGTDPDGGTWYSGSTKEITVTSTSVTVNTNNPVDITFHFDPETLRFHGGNVPVTIVDSITVWQPTPTP